MSKMYKKGQNGIVEGVLRKEAAGVISSGNDSWNRHSQACCYSTFRDDEEHRDRYGDRVVLGEKGEETKFVRDYQAIDNRKCQKLPSTLPIVSRVRLTM